MKLFARKVIANTLSASGLTAFLAPHLKRGWAILMYHRIVDPESLDYPVEPGMFVRPRTFEMHLQELQRDWDVIELDQLVERVLKNDFCDRPLVSITFDDGWLDNYQHAFPLLRAADLPATIFLATEFIDSDRYFWSDRLQMALLSVSHDDLKSAFDTQPDTEGLRKIFEAAESAFRSRGTQRDFLTALDTLLNRVKSLDDDQRLALVDAIDPPSKHGTRTRAFLNWQEIEEMAAHRIRFGSHTHQHRYLAANSPVAFTTDLLLSVQALRSHTPDPSRVFCYPGGYYSEASQAALSSFSINSAHAPFFSAALSVGPTDLAQKPPLFGRVGIHEDISSTAALFENRVAGLL